MLTVNIKIRNQFFDRRKVMKAIERVERRNLSRAGAFIRTAARSSIKTRKYGTYSAPGSPPFDHTGFAISRENRRRKKVGLEKMVRKKTAFNQGLRAILFGYNESRKSVIVGPVGFGGRSTVPQTLEHGGTAVIGSGNRRRTVTIEARPFMAPALKRELPNLPRQWRSSVRA